MNTRRILPLLAAAMTACALVVPLPAQGAPAARHPAPEITSISPNHGPRGGGNTITIKGRHLAGVNEVTIAYASYSSAPTSSTATKLTYVVPSEFSSIVGGRSAVTVHSHWGTSEVNRTSHYLYTYPHTPKLASVSPAAGDISGRERVQLTGFLPNVKSIWFGSTKAPSFSYNGRSDGSVTTSHLFVTAPKHAAGTVHVRVKTDAGYAKSAPTKTFTYSDHGKPNVTEPTPPATVGALYTGALTTTDDRTGTWHVTSGHLPHGLKLHTGSGVVTGTPTTAGKAKFAVKFVDARGRSTRAHRAITIAPQTWRAQRASGLSVACVATSCYLTDAVYDEETDGGAPTLGIETSGGDWRGVTIDPPGAADHWDDADPSAIDCGSHSQCALVGITNEDVDEGDTETGFLSVPSDPSHWTSVFAPLPAGAGPDDGSAMEAVACGTDTCTAVGELDPYGWPGDADTPAFGKPLIERFSDGAWTAAEPDLSGTGLTGVVLTAVGCLADGDCTAAGVAETTGDTQKLVAVRIPATGEPTVRKVPMPAGDGHAWISRLSCATGLSCIALGSIGNQNSGAVTPFYARLANGSWHTSSFPAPKGLRRSSLQVADLACLAGSTCYAVGHGMRSNRQEPVVEVFSGTKVSSYVATLPAGKDDVGLLSSVACRSNGQCIAGGGYHYLLTARPGLFIAHLGTGSATSKQVRLGPGASASSTDATIRSLSCDDVCVALADAHVHGAYTTVSLTTAH